jgi:hypothetical protein
MLSKTWHGVSGKRPPVRRRSILNPHPWPPGARPKPSCRSGVIRSLARSSAASASPRKPCCRSGAIRSPARFSRLVAAKVVRGAPDAAEHDPRPEPSCRSGVHPVAAEPNAWSAAAAEPSGPRPSPHASPPAPARSPTPSARHASVRDRPTHSPSVRASRPPRNPRQEPDMSADHQNKSPLAAPDVRGPHDAIADLPHAPSCANPPTPLYYPWKRELKGTLKLAVNASIHRLTPFAYSHYSVRGRKAYPSGRCAPRRRGGSGVGYDRRHTKRAPQGSRARALH